MAAQFGLELRPIPKRCPFVPAPVVQTKTAGMMPKKERASQAGIC